MKNTSFITWSSSGDMLAVATTKGNLFIYDRRNGKRVPIVGKHSKSIDACIWLPSEDLACGSQDKSITISNRDGDTTLQMTVKAEPTNMQYSICKRNGIDVTYLSMVLGSKTIMLMNCSDPNDNVELTFQSKYGSIAKYSWLGENALVVGFSSGYLVAVSIIPAQLNQELFSSKSFRDSVQEIVLCRALGAIAAVGDGVVKIHDMSNLEDIIEVIQIENNRGGSFNLCFSEDGQFLSIGSKESLITTYLAKLPALANVFFDRIAYMSSLTEITVGDYSSKQSIIKTTSLPINIEPTLISLGPTHLAICEGANVSYHPISPIIPTPSDNISFVYTSDVAKPEPVAFSSKKWVKEYVAPVVTLSMNNQVAVVYLANGEIHMHPLVEAFFDPNNVKSTLTLIFPEEEHAQTPEGAIVEVTCATATSSFLIYGTSNGQIVHYDLDEILLANKYQHPTGIKRIYPMPGMGAKFIFIDNADTPYLMSPIFDVPTKLPEFPKNFKGVLWETNPHPGRYVFVVWNEISCVTFVYTRYTVKGGQCVAINSGATRVPHGLNPILLLDGKLMCQTASGKIEALILATHETLTPSQFLLKYTNEKDQGRALRMLYILGKMDVIWSYKDAIQLKKVWTILAEAALHSLDIPVARRIYRDILADPAMVLNLLRIEQVEDLNELQGHVAVIFGDFSLAQQCFLNSNNPKEALYLRRDILEWDQALALAPRLAPEEVPRIAREYALQLEMDGKPVDALAMYKKALDSPLSDEFDNDRAEHEQVCRMGIVRMTLRTGDISQGMVLLNDVTDKQLLQECSGILDGLNQYVEEALILERGEMYEAAAEVWIKLKNWGKVGKLINKVGSSKIFSQYAAAKEAEKQYVDAASAYEKAKDYDNVARILIDHVNDLEGAAQLIRKTRSRESAKLLSKALVALRDFKSAAEFYLIAGMQIEAFEIAKRHDVMEHFALLVQDDASNDMLCKIANYFEGKGQFLLAGKFHLLSSHYQEALRMFIQDKSLDGSNVDLAIETIGQAKNDALTHQLIDFLMGETDGVPKDAKYIFKLYMSLKQYREAARTAIIIAREEQILGNYRAAHDLLLENYRQLKRSEVKIPAELDRMLMILHSYTLVKTLVRIDDHLKGARMLIRVSNNISKFPAHIVPILTSTVVECHRSGLKKEAFDFAAILMRPEYRQQIDQKFKRKIEQIVRRPEMDEIEEPLTPCPVCATPLAESSLDCTECKSTLPYCIATGQHLILDQWCICPSCEFPALINPFKELLTKTNQCPMCYSDISPDNVQLVVNPESYLKGKKNDIEQDVAVNPST